MKKIISILLVCAMLFAVTACASAPTAAPATQAAAPATEEGGAPATEETAPVAEAAGDGWDETWDGVDKVKIGFLGSLTTTNAVEGVPSYQAAQVAVQLCNEAGGINGKQIELVPYDIADSAEAAIKGVNYLAEQGVVCISGCLNTNNTMQCGSVIDGFGIPTTVYGTNPITNQQGWHYIVRCVANSACYHDSMQKMIEQLGVKKAAFITNMDEWGQAGLEDWEKRFDAMGVDLVASESYVNDDIDFQGQISKIIAAEPDIVFTYCQNMHLPLVLKQLRQMGYEGLCIDAEPGAASAIREIAGSAANGLLFTSGSVTADSLDDDMPEVQRTFNEKYYEMFGELPAYDTANRTFDGTNMLINAITNAKSLDRDKVMDALLSLKGMPAIGGNLDCTLEPGEAFAASQSYAVADGKNVLWDTWFAEYGAQYMVK